MTDGSGQEDRFTLPFGDGFIIADRFDSEAWSLLLGKISSADAVPEVWLRLDAASDGSLGFQGSPVYQHCRLQRSATAPMSNCWLMLGIEAGWHFSAVLTVDHDTMTLEMADRPTPRARPRSTCWTWSVPDHVLPQTSPGTETTGCQATLVVTPSLSLTLTVAGEPDLEWQHDPVTRLLSLHRAPSRELNPIDMTMHVTRSVIQST